jgi:hypothetical protein
MAENKSAIVEQEKSYEIQDLQNSGSALSTITKVEIDTQIATAHAYPRSLEKYQKKAMAMLALNEEIAEECFYVIPRAGKTIEGPSVRLAEIVAAAYGNLRSGARVVAEEAEFVVAQGVCHDLENNVAVTFEIKRRITDQRGYRYNSDMIGVTGNAATSIAFRNSVFRVVPKALWRGLYEHARKVAKGDEKTFEVKREATLIGFEKLKVPRKKIFKYLGIEGVADMTAEHVITLIGIGNAIKNGEATIADLEPLPSGKIELEADSVLSAKTAAGKELDGIPEKNTQTSPASSGTPEKKVREIGPEARQRDNTRVFFEVGEKLTIVSGHTLHIKDDLPKLGAKWDAEARVWRLPAPRTDELVALCQKKQVSAVEVGADKPKETGSEMLWPHAK